MQVYEAPNYRAFVRHCLDQGTPVRPRSTKKSLADHLKCHATFISHVVADKADLSSEQGVRFASFYGMDAGATDYFIDLLGRDRAGDVATRELFDARLERQRLAWLTLQNRLTDEERLSGDQQRQYFESWMLQLVHLCCMIPERNTLAKVAAALGLPPVRVEGALRTLAGMGLLAEEKGSFVTRPKRIHLDRSSPTFKTCHSNWRVKIAADVASYQDPTGVHYTSAMTISKAAAEQLRQDVLAHIEAARNTAMMSAPEEIFVMALDLYAVTGALEQDE